MILLVCKQEQLRKIKKDTFDCRESNAFPCLGLHLKPTLVEIRCFYYILSNLKIIRNNSKIMKYRNFSFFFITSPPF